MFCKAYIPSEREPIHVGASCWVQPLMRVICVADTNMLVSKKLCVPNANPNHPNANSNQPIDTPNANNIVPVGHVDFVLFVLCFLALGSQREHGFWWNTGLTVQLSDTIKSFLDMIITLA